MAEPSRHVQGMSSHKGDPVTSGQLLVQSIPSPHADRRVERAWRPSIIGETPVILFIGDRVHRRYRTADSGTNRGNALGGKDVLRMTAGA